MYFYLCLAQRICCGTYASSALSACCPIYRKALATLQNTGPGVVSHEIGRLGRNASRLSRSLGPLRLGISWLERTRDRGLYKLFHLSASSELAHKLILSNEGRSTWQVLRGLH